MPKSWSARFILGSGTATTAIGLLVLVGWMFRSVAIIQILPWYAPMQRNTAFGFVLCGLGFLLSNRGSLGRKWSRAFGLAAGILGFATLLEYAFSIDLHIDEALGSAWAMTRAPYLGRMSPLTALCFVLMGTAMVAAWGGGVSRWRSWVIALTSTFASAIALAGIFSYLLGGSTILGWTAVTWMAAHTATCFLVLGSSLITQAWTANKNTQDGHSQDVATAEFPPWAPLCTGIGAGSVLLSLIQSALSLDGSQHRDVFHLAGFLAAVILVLFFTVMVPMELEHKITTGLWMAFAAFVFTAYFSFRSLALDQESEAWVTHTSEVLAVTGDATNHLRKSLMGYRGYFWSGVTSELDQWQENIVLTRSDFSRLRLLTSDNSRQQHVLDQVDVLFLQTVAGVEERIAFQKQRGTTVGLEEFRNSHASASMRALDLLVLGMQEEERRLMRRRMVAQA